MKPTLYWQQAPRSVVRDLLPKLTWQRLGEKSAARDTAALMLYVALLFVRDGQIVPFTHFRLRSKHELNAMKLYLYLARVIGRGKTYAEASYEKIFEGIGVQERDIRRAISVLIASGLLRNVDRKDSGDETGWGPNMYYLAGHQDLFRTPAKREAEASTAEAPIA